MKRLLVLLTIALAAPLRGGDKEFLDAVSRPVLLQVPGMKDVQVRRNAVYRHNPDLAADIYSPKSSHAPVVIFIHGGVGADLPVRPKDWGSYQSWGRLVAASGFVGVTFNHRLGYPEPHMREAASDLEELIRYVRANAKSLGADADRINLMAFSAGGPLLSPALRDHPRYIRSIVSLYNFLDIEHTLEHPRYEPAEV